MPKLGRTATAHSYNDIPARITHTPSLTPASSYMLCTDPSVPFDTNLQDCLYSLHLPLFHSSMADKEFYNGQEQKEKRLV